MIGDYSVPQMQPQWRPSAMQTPMPPMRQQSAPMPMQLSGSMLAFVPNVRDIESVSVQPGQRVFVMAQNEPVLACRDANGMGVVQTTYCKLEPYEPTAAAATPSPEYVTRAEFDEFVKKLLGHDKEAEK